MKPSPKNPSFPTKIECACGWSRMLSAGENADEAARYHAIQVHNDQTAAHGKF